MIERKLDLEDEVIIKTAFQDADPMGVIFHGNYFRFFQAARDQVMDKLKYNYHEMKEGGHVWPVIDCYVKYIKPIPFNHEIRITAKLTQWEHMVRFDYVIYDAKTHAKLTKGYTRQVAVTIEDQSMLCVTPEIFTEKLEPYFVD